MKKRIIAMFLTGCMVMLSSMGNVYATSSSAIEQMVLKFLGDVAGIDINNYEIISLTTSASKMLNLPHYQTDIKVVIANADAQFEVIITLIDEKMWIYNLYGEFKEDALTFRDCLTVTYNRLASYQMFAGSLYGKFAEMLLKAISEEKTKVEVEEFTLNVSYMPTNYRENVVIRYTRKISGYEFPGDYFVVSVSKNGLLTHILDNTLYYVATTDVNVSIDEAISKALPYAEEYASQHGQEITAVDATFELTKDIGCVRGDNFAIYPQWSVWITFDKVNEENIFGYVVMIWADNGEVYHYEPQGFYNPSPKKSPSANFLWQLAVVITATIILFPALTTYARYRTRRSNK
ncbi:MAG: hypothetical protein QW270_08485 [Candidatus Bathyarchaeia archaeon]